MMSGLNRSLSLSLNSRIFKCDQNSKNISEKLQSFYQKQEFSDIVLVAAIDNYEIHAHKIILSAASEYFLAMFRSTLKERNANKIELQDIDGMTLKLIADFMYTATIELRSETVERILRASDFFQIKSLITACCDFMTEQLDVDNCLGITLFAEQYEYTMLHRKSLAFVLTNFQQVHKAREFLSLNEQQLSKIISNDDLCADSEEIVFLSIVAWVEHDKANREHLMTNLLLNVRFSLLKSEFIVENRHSLSIKSFELMTSWLDSCSSQPKEHSRSRRKSEKLIFVSNNADTQFIVQSYNPELKKWVKEEDLPCLPLPQLISNIAAVGNKLIVAGEYCGSLPKIHHCACLDIKTNSWTELPPMSIARIFFEMIDLSGYLYVVGGATTDLNYTLSNAVERYDFDLGKWQNVASCPSNPERLKLAVVGKLLYAMGENQMYCYNPETEKWTLKKSKNVKLNDYSIAGLNGYLYAVGGMCNLMASQIVERYDPTQDTWTTACSLRVGVANSFCTSFNNRFIACCGQDGQSRMMNLVQEYDPETDEWTTLAPLLGKSHLSEYIVSYLLVLKS